MAKTRYRSTSGERIMIGGVDRHGSVHPPLLCHPECEVADDEGETYDQTLRAALSSGVIEIVDTSPAPTSKRKAT